MALSEHYLTEELHPIDMVESIAQYYEWDFDRVGEDQIAMTVDGQWRNYSVTLAWSHADETLRLICTFEMDPPEDRMATLHEGLNEVNDQCWAGAFSYWAEEKLMVYKYGLMLAGGNFASAEQVDTMITAAILSAERYYPAFQLMSWTDKTVKEALQIAIAEAYGHA